MFPRRRRCATGGSALEAAEAAAARAKALADPTRLMLAVALRDAEGELCVCDLSWVAERSEKLVSHHVRALRAAGLVRSRRDGKMVMYALTDAGGALVDAVLGEVRGRRARRQSSRCCRWRPAGAGARGPGARSPSPGAAAERYRVEGMDCAACAQTVEKVVGRARRRPRRAGVVRQRDDGRRGRGRARPRVRGGRARRLPRGAGDAAAAGEPAGAVLAARRAHGLDARRRSRCWRSRSSRRWRGAPRAVAEPLYLASMAVGGWPIARAALAALRRRRWT